MTTDRPYKEKMTFDDARKELIRCKGTQFDPEVVKAMLRVIDKLLANGK
jgi:HD-GYP domain-containing protein (c-di-GMP phosphodiesterase class II)